MNNIRGGAFLSYIAMFLSSLISIIYTPLMLDYLGKSEFGLYNLVLPIISYLGLVQLGIGSAYIRWFYKYKVKNDIKSISKLNGTYMLIYFVLSIIVSIGGFIILSNIRWILGEKLTVSEIVIAKKLVIILIINMIVTFIGSPFSAYITANARFIFQKLLGIVTTIITPIFNIIVLLGGFGSIGLAMVTTLVNITSLIVCFLYCKCNLNFSMDFRNLNISLVKSLFAFSFYIFLNAIIDQINWSVDKIIIGRIINTAAVGIYAIASQFNAYYLSFSTNIVNVFTPKINEIVAKEEKDMDWKLTQLFTKVGRVQFLILALVLSGFILFGNQFIVLWLGEGYREVYYVTLLLLIPVTIPCIQNIGIEVQKAKNKHQFRSWLYFFIALFNVIFSIPLCMIFDITGCAFGTATALIIGNGIIMNCYYHYRIGIDIKYFWKRISSMFKGIFLAILIGSIMSFIPLNNYLSFVFVALVYTVIYCISAYFLSCNYEEKIIVNQLLKKWCKRVRI